MFVNRIRELKFLKEAGESKKAELVCLYGRRRVGKTELVNKFLEMLGGERKVYYLSDTMSKKKQLSNFSNAIAAEFKDGTLARQPFGEWDDAFYYLSKHGEKAVIAIDEFPYLVSEDAGLPGIIQKYWDSTIKKTGLKIVLCGSSFSFMGNLLGHGSPLYGRFTGEWQVEPLEFGEAARFFPTLSLEEKSRAYGMLGGIQAYLEKYDSKKSFKENVREVIKKGSTLYNEPYYLIKEDVKAPANYFAIMQAIAKGETSFSKIINETGIEKTTLPKYLQALEQIRFIEREIPFGESALKKGRYRISDNFLNFWFKYIFPNKYLLELGREQQVAETILNDYDNYMGRRFEEIGKAILLHAEPEISSISRWWHNDCEIDAVATNAGKTITWFAEIKWGKLSAAEAGREITALKQKIGEYKPKTSVKIAIIAREIAEKNSLNTSDTLALDLKDLKKL